MNELLPDLFHWRVHNPDIDYDVDCYWAASGGACYVLDPLTPDDGLGWFAGQRAPEHIYMTNRLHDRSCADFATAFGAPIWCPRTGVHEYEDGSLDVSPYDAGELVGGVLAVEVGVICPDEMTLRLPIDSGVLAIADSLIRYDGVIGFVPDHLMDEPERVKAETKAVFLRLCDELDFDHLLFAHGDPLVGEGKEALRQFCSD